MMMITLSLNTMRHTDNKPLQVSLLLCLPTKPKIITNSQVFNSNQTKIAVPLRILTKDGQFNYRASLNSFSISDIRALRIELPITNKAVKSK